MSDYTQRESEENPGRSRKTVTQRRSLATRKHQPLETRENCPKLLGALTKETEEGRRTEIKFAFGILI